MQFLTFRNLMLCLLALLVLELAFVSLFTIANSITILLSQASTLANFGGLMGFLVALATIWLTVRIEYFIFRRFR